MRKHAARATRGREPAELDKAPTGIGGVDEITGGGLPRGRPTLVCGSPGCGKTLFGMEFLVRGATTFREPGVFIGFEETAEELSANVRSLGFDLEQLTRRKLLVIDHVRVERSEIEETGEYNLDGLFIRLAHAIDAVQAKRVVLDTVEALFTGFSNIAVLRAELRRLFGWLKDRGVTAVITGERGEGQLTRQGLEEYVSDCVILLDNRVRDELTTRRLRIVKYRGSRHGTNEYPFLIDADGISVLPITSVGLDHAVTSERISIGVPALDVMLGGKGVYRGTSVLVSGTAGSGKTSLVAHFIDASCRRGERCLFFSYEESSRQIVRNMRSIGVDLEPWLARGLLQIRAVRPSTQGLEMHLVAIHKLIREVRPEAVVVDPITSLVTAGTRGETKSTLIRLIDGLKSNAITALFTSLTGPDGHGGLETSDAGVSSLIDTWVLLRNAEANGERNRTLYVLKSRGMEHSNQVREFKITDSGITLAPPYLGPHGVLTGSARIAQEARDREEVLAALEERARRTSALATRREEIASQIAALEAQLGSVSGELEQLLTDDTGRAARLEADRRSIADSRYARAASRRPRPPRRGGAASRDHASRRTSSSSSPPTAPAEVPAKVAPANTRTRRTAGTRRTTGNGRTNKTIDGAGHGR